MHHSSDFMSAVVVKVRKIDRRAVWVFGLVMNRRKSDFSKSDKESRFPEISYRGSALSRSLGD